MSRVDDFLARGIDGALIERVDRPSTGLFAFSLAKAGARAVLLVAEGAGRTLWAIVAERPRGQAADPAVRRHRERLEGTRITALRASPRALVFDAGRQGVTWRVEATAKGLTTRLLPEGGASDAPRIDDNALRHAAERGSTFHEDWQSAEVRRLRAAAVVKLRRARERLLRRLRAVDADLAAVVDAEARAAFASLFVAAAARARTGATLLRATDWSSGAPTEVTFELSPDRPAREQLEAAFGLGKRRRAGVPIAEARKRQTEVAVGMVDGALGRVEAAPDAAVVETIVAELARQLPGDVRLTPAASGGDGGARARVPERRPYHPYLSETGDAILVGRDANDNDVLTLRVARPGDLWLHARDVSGSHVVVPGARRGGTSGDPRVLIDAATLAAHFSAARGEAVVDVVYVDRRHVSKPKGSPPGAVRYRDEKVIAVRVEPSRLARLLASRDRPG